MRGGLLELAKSSAIYGSGTMLQRFVTLLLLPVFTRFLIPEEYGIIAMMSIVAMVAHPIFSLGMGAAMGPSYFESHNDTQKSKTVWTTLSILFASATLLILLAWGLPKYLLRIVFLPAEYSPLLSLMLTGTALSVLATPLMLRVQLEKQAGKFVFVTLAASFIQIVLSVYFIVFLGWGILGLVLSSLRKR